LFSRGIHKQNQAPKASSRSLNIVQQLPEWYLFSGFFRAHTYDKQAAKNPRNRPFQRRFCPLIAEDESAGKKKYSVPVFFLLTSYRSGITFPPCKRYRNKPDARGRGVGDFGGLRNTLSVWGFPACISTLS
jgi:hypothetical protein